MKRVEIVETIGDKTFEIVKEYGCIRVRCKNKRSEFGPYMDVFTSGPNSGKNTVSMSTHGRYSIDIHQFKWVMSQINELLDED